MIIQVAPFGGRWTRPIPPLRIRRRAGPVGRVRGTTTPTAFDALSLVSHAELHYARARAVLAGENGPMPPHY